MKMVENIAALTIAGSDPGAGAGVYADLKTFFALGVYGTAVITAVTAQDFREVTAVQPIDPEIVEKQLIAVLGSFPIKAIKTGMLFSAEIIETAAGILKRYPGLPLVIDPVLASTSGRTLLREEAVVLLERELFPLSVLVTPNIAEAEILGDINIDITTPAGLEKAAVELYKKFKIPVLLKGGHFPGSACDVLCDNRGTAIFSTGLVKGVNNHGSGCTFAAAITARLACGLGLREAVSQAKTYITGALQSPHQLDEATRVINHAWDGINESLPC
ncbi:MAG: bifunctional hydroxymethylpyrimidine kinase/phosphomethylpyrimidine kinase [Candidatus Aminicenantes bacterium]|nr:bifunctional hydroxymethylpyrimidine kinase/phosphomethylpyrimidine kinase [Candidatus Aminicenantes bacterium]